MNKNDVTAVVMAHERAAPTVHRHMPLWENVAGRVLVVVPENQRIAGTCCHSCIPDNGPYSQETNIRALAALMLGYASGSPYVMLLEYDSLCWGPIPDRAVPEPGSMAATRFANEPSSPVPGKTFLGSFYLHFPHLYSRLALELVIGTIRESMDVGAEHGYTDRFLGLAVERAGVPVLDWNKRGLSCSYENISKHPHRVDECVEAVRNGALFSHGIKDEPSLDKILAVSPWATKAIPQ